MSEGAFDIKLLRKELLEEKELTIQLRSEIEKMTKEVASVNREITQCFLEQETLLGENMRIKFNGV